MHSERRRADTRADLLASCQWQHVRILVRSSWVSA